MLLCGVSKHASLHCEARDKCDKVAAYTDMDDSTLRSRLDDIGKRMNNVRHTEASSQSSAVSKALGTETTLSVLTDTRGLLSDILVSLTEIKEQNEERLRLERERTIREDERHNDLCKILLELERQSRTPSVAHSQQLSPIGAPRQRSQEKYYYGNQTISTGVHAISCIVMHLDSLLINDPRFSSIKSTDAVHMDIKNWYAVCNTVISADKNVRSGLRIPKPSDDDFRTVCRVVASTRETYRPMCDPQSIEELTSSATAVMNTVEWVRNTMVTCVGIVSPERTCRFKNLSYPYINEEKKLNIKVSGKMTMPRKSLHADVSSMSAAHKKAYVSLMLTGGYKPVDAIAIAKQ